MMPKTTHTLAELELSQFAYDEIARKLREAGYEHAFGIGNDEGLIDMSGIGVVRASDPKLDKVSYVMCEKKTGGNYVVATGFFDLQSAQDFHTWVCEGSSKQSKREPYAWTRSVGNAVQFTTERALATSANSQPAWTPLYRE